MKRKNIEERSKKNKKKSFQCAMEHHKKHRLRREKGSYVILEEPEKIQYDDNLPQAILDCMNENIKILH